MYVLWYAWQLRRNGDRTSAHGELFAQLATLHYLIINLATTCTAPEHMPKCSYGSSNIPGGHIKVSHYQESPLNRIKNRQ